MNTHIPTPAITAKTRSFTIPLTQLECVCCADELESTVRANPAVIHAHVDFQAEILHIDYKPDQTDEPAIRQLVEESGRCRCADDAAATDVHADMAHMHHRADMAPVTMGTKADRMQYELPASSAHAAHDAGHSAAMSHHGMDHDMSDPGMARAMELDMRNRFLVSLLLTIPTVLYSPLGSDFFGLNLPTGPFTHNWLMFLLATPVVLWGGWIFITGAFTSLRHGALNMSVLIATGVLAAYLFSVVITVANAFADGQQRAGQMFFGQRVLSQFAIGAAQHPLRLGFNVRIAGHPRMLRVVAACMNVRSRWSGIATGDQALFMTRAAFDAVGGFPDQPLMEDIEMSKRLRTLSRPACLRERVITSGRRWEARGVWSTIVLMWRLRWAYWRGASPQALARRYE